MSQAIREIAHPSPKLQSYDMSNMEMNETVCAGITRLLEGQQRFAEEFGLSLEHVFQHGHVLQRQQTTENFLQQCLTGDEAHKIQLEKLLNDLIEHNMALYAALDGVAKQSLEKLSPTMVQARGFRLFGWRPFAWLSYRRLHRSYQTNDYLRHQDLIVNGFAKEYISYREHLLKTSQCDTSDK